MPARADSLSDLLSPGLCSGSIVRADAGDVLSQRGTKGERLRDVMLQFVTVDATDTSRVIKLSANNQITYYPDLKLEIQYFRPWVAPREFAGIVHIAVPESRLGGTVSLLSNAKVCSTPDVALVGLLRSPLIAKLPNTSVRPPDITFAKPGFTPQPLQISEDLRQEVTQPPFAQYRPQKPAPPVPQRDKSGKCSVADHPARVWDAAFPDMSAIPDGSQQTGISWVIVSLDSAGNTTDVRIRQSAGDDNLDREAMRAARDTIFESAVRDCKRISGNYLFRVEFQAQ